LTCHGVTAVAGHAVTDHVIVVGRGVDVVAAFFVVDGVRIGGSGGVTLALVLVALWPGTGTRNTLDAGLASVAAAVFTGKGGVAKGDPVGSPVTGTGSIMATDQGKRRGRRQGCAVPALSIAATPLRRFRPLRLTLPRAPSPPPPAVQAPVVCSRRQNHGIHPSEGGRKEGKGWKARGRWGWDAR